jgi:hypothetical protein
MKRILGTALAFSLIGATAASADPYDHGYRSDHSYGYRDYHSYRRHDDNGAAIFAGLGILTLAAVLASQHRDHDGWYDRDHGYYRNDDGYYRNYDRGDGYSYGYSGY